MCHWCITHAPLMYHLCTTYAPLVYHFGTTNRVTQFNKGFHECACKEEADLQVGRCGRQGRRRIWFQEHVISRNHAHCILHSRFPPFGFIWKPAGSIPCVLHVLCWISFQKMLFRETMSIAFSIVDFPPSGSYWSPVARCHVFYTWWWW